MVSRKRFGVSIHAPREGRDAYHAYRRDCSRKFQSTRPVKGATTRSQQLRRYEEFQSTRPVKGATSSLQASASVTKFQSTRPVKGATTL